MTESGELDPSAPSGTPRPEWEKDFSRQIEELASLAQTFKVAWNKAYPEDCFQNTLYLKQYASLVQGHAVVRAFGRIYARASGSPETAEIGFLYRFQRSLVALTDGGEFAGHVPVGLLYYLEEAISQGRAQKLKNQVPDPDPIARVLEFGKEILSHPALGAFRMDILDPFPWSALPPGTPAAPGPSKDPEEAPQVPRSQLPKGYRLGKLEVERLLGEGGFAQVYLVYYPALADWRAAKAFTKLHAQGHEVERLRKAFFDECRLQNQLKHPNIVRVIDVDEHEGYLVLIMEYVEGRDLGTLIEERRHAGGYFSPQEILRIAIDITRALIFAHSQEIVHRDIKPANILIDVSGVAKVTDFGLAKTLNGSGERRTTRVGSLIGTPHYMAPEQIFEDKYDPRIDLYSLGALLYHLTLGEPPFQSKDPWSILSQHRSRKPVPIADLREGFPEDLARIILRLLEKSPDNRPKNAVELLRDLEACQAGLADGMTHVEQQPWERRRAGRSRRLVTLAGAVLVVFALALYAFQGFLARRALPIPPSSRASGDWLAPRETGKDFPGMPEPKLKGSPAKVPRAPAVASPLVSKETSALPVIDGSGGKPDPSRSNASDGAKERPKAVPRLREKLIAQRPGPREAAELSDLLLLFERHEPELHQASYRGLQGALVDFEKGHADQDKPAAIRSEYARSHLGAARRMLVLAQEAVQAHLGALRSARRPIQIKTAQGATLAGEVTELDDTKLMLRGDQGGIRTIEIRDLALTEFIPEAGAPAAEVAFRGLTLDPARTIPLALDLESADEAALLFIPFLVRLARLETQRKAGETAREAVETLKTPEGTSASITGLIHHVDFAATQKAFLKEESRTVPVYPDLAREFQGARREGEALELLLARRFSQVLATYRETASAPSASELLQSSFESSLKEGSEELLGGSGWWNNRWEVWPKEPSLKERQKIFDPGNPQAILFRDPLGPRHLIMNDATTRAPEGLLIRMSFVPEEGEIEKAYWAFLLRGGRTLTDTSVLRVNAAAIGLYHPILGSGAQDLRLSEAPLPPTTSADAVRTISLLPAEEGLYVFVDRKLALLIPQHQARIPHQLDITVCRGTATFQCMQAKKPSPEPTDREKK